MAKEVLRRVVTDFWGADKLSDDLRDEVMREFDNHGQNDIEYVLTIETDRSKF